MSNNRAPLAIRLLIWVMAAAIGATGLLASGLTRDASAPAAASATPTVAAASMSALTPAVAPAAVGNGSSCNPAANSPAKTGTKVGTSTKADTIQLDYNCIDLLVDKYCTADNPATADVDEAAKCDPNVFLPSSRWKDRLDNIMASQPGGWGNLGESATYQFSTMLGGFLMSIAGFIWALIFGLAGFLSSIDLLAGTAGRKVNTTFVTLSQALTSSGLIALVFLATAVVLIRQILRMRSGGMPSGIIATIMTMVMPMALLFSMTTAGAQTVKTVGGVTVESGKDPAGVFMSPVWLAQKGIWLAEMPSAVFGQQFKDSNPAFNQDQLLNPSCSAYTQVLIEAYKEAWSRKHPLQTSGASMSIVVNGLWNEAFMTFYNDGQFQNSFSGQRIVCHMLDGYSGISPAEQAVIAAAARYPAGRNANKVVSTFSKNTDPGSDDLRYFAPYASLDGDFGKDGMDDKRKYVLPWAACAYVGGGAGDAAASWAVDPAWYNASSVINKGQKKASEMETVTSSGCATWWSKGHKEGDTPILAGDAWQMLRFQNSSKDTIRGVQSDFGAITGVASSNCGDNKCIDAKFGNESLSGFSKTVLVTKGEIGGWLFSALMALVAAFMYLYVLGGMFAGLLLAKVGFAVLLAVSPGILLLLAIPNVNGRKNSRGMKLLRTMIGWMVSAALISSIIMIFALFISLIRQFLGSPSGGVVYVISPALSLVLLHFLMKAAGLGSLMSPTGGLGLATGAASAAASGNLKDLGKGQKQLQGVKKKGQEFANKRQQRKQRLDRVRNSSRLKGGKSYKEMMKDDPEFARKNAASGLLEARRFKKAAEEGKGDAAVDAAKKAEADEAKKLADEAAAKTSSDDPTAKKDAVDGAEASALGELDDKGNPVKDARDARTAARLDDPSQDAELAAAATATSGSAAAFEQLLAVKADTDVLGDFASTDLEAVARLEAGQMLASSALAAGHLDAMDSQTVVAEAASYLERSGEGAHRGIIMQNAAASLGLVNADGGMLETAAGTPVLGFQHPTTGEMVTPHSQEFAQLVTLTQAAAAGGSLANTIEHAGVSYQLSSSMGSIGEEGRTSARAAVASELGIDAADVIVSRTGASMTLAPALGTSAIPGTTMVRAASADAQVAVARNITQYFDANTNAVLESLPPASRSAAIETIVQTLSADGRPPDALALLGIDESNIRIAHADGTPAAMANLLDGKVFEVPATVLRASLAEASAARSLVSASPLHVAAIHDISFQSGAALSTASATLEEVMHVAETKLVTGDYTAEDQHACYRGVLRALSDITVVRSAVVAVDGAARNDMSGTNATMNRAVVEQQREIEVLKERYERADSIPDPQRRLEAVTTVLLDHTKSASEALKRAERAHNSGIEKVLESLGSRGSRAARKNASTDLPFS